MIAPSLDTPVEEARPRLRHPVHADVSPQLCVRTPREVDEQFIAAWRRLCAAAHDPHPFLAPDFLLPLAESLPCPPELRLLSLEDSAGQLKLLGAFEDCRVSSELPFPHLSEFTSPFSYRGGLLIAADGARRHLRTFLDQVSRRHSRHGVIFRTIPLEGPLARTLGDECRSSGITNTIQNAQCRAVLRLDELDERELVAQACSKSRRKSLRRAQRSLQQRGPVSFSVAGDGPAVEAACDRFLQLEDSGWKGDRGTSLNSNPAHRDFLSEVVRRLGSRGQVLFAELRVGERVVASSCNLVAGRTLFAFKIGWDAEFQEGCPGYWNEIELVEYLRAARTDIRAIDGCSSPGSYLESLYPHRQTVADIVVAGSRRATIYTAVRQSLRTVKRQLDHSPAGSVNQLHPDLLYLD